MARDDIADPVINSPYGPPKRYFKIGPEGPTGEVLDGRRPSESYIPVPPAKKGRRGKGEALQLDFDVTGERREPNSLINDVRREVELWRNRGWGGVTPYTRKLLSHWSAGLPTRDDPVLFCQREAAETAIFLGEVAGRHGYADYRRRIEPENRVHNDGLPRVGLKMATGSGKTVVMAMLIAWQTINKVMTPRDARFAKRFLVVTPGITIRDRLGVLHPERDDNYYKERDLVPVELWDALHQADVQVTNYHVFLPRDSKEIEGVSSNTRKLLRGGSPGAPDEFQETPDMVAARVMRRFTAGKGEFVVLNDEAHHCYQDKVLEHPDDAADSEDEERNREARVWFKGLVELQRRAGIKTVYDLSATPYYLKGSGYNEGFIFPWVVSDFSLMDAIESGIVKVPRIPVDDDAAVKPVVFRDLWDQIEPPLPKRRSTRPKDVDGVHGWTMPSMLQAAIESLYRSYERNYQDYDERLALLGEPPPVMIVVCPNTVVSKLMFDWVAGRELADGRLFPGNLALFSNVEDGTWTTRQRTILVDSEQLESERPLTDEFRKYAAREIEAFKQALRLRSPGADVEKLTDADLLREAMNTIGKKDKLGEHIRCVVSVAMLTEGWDANTVTHILGVRPFRSQLLCEQVVGRGLRRRSYVADPETGLFEAEYADVYGVPFAFIPTDRPAPKTKLPRPAVEVRAVPERWDMAIAFPKLDGYRVELPDEALHADFDESSRLHLRADELPPLWAQSQWLVGKPEDVELDDIRNARGQTVAFHLAKALAEREEFFAALDGVERPWLFPQLVDICRRWLDECFSAGPGASKGHLLLTQIGYPAANKVFGSIVRYPGGRAPELMPILRPFDSRDSTDEVHFLTRKVVMEPPPTKSPLNHVVLDGLRGNSWEEALAQALEADPRVLSYVKNERLGFAIPYVHEGRTHEYVPDFLVRLVTEPADVERTLIVEVSGSRKSPGPTATKAATARNQWCAAVNNWGELGRWGYVEIGNPSYPKALDLLDGAINNLYADNPVIGLPV